MKPLLLSIFLTVALCTTSLAADELTIEATEQPNM